MVSCFFLAYLMITHQKIKSVGGQAVIEGVMMRSPKNWTVAVRDPHADRRISPAEGQVRIR